MSAIKDGRYPIELNGKTYHLLFDLNALDAVQDRFGGYDKLDEIFNTDNPNMVKDLKWLFTLLINEGMSEGETEVTEQQVGKLIHVGNLTDVQNAIYASFAYGAGGGEKTEDDETDEDGDEDDDEGNLASAPQN